MEQALLQVGLPVICGFGDCGLKGFVKPKNYDGWYKSRLLRGQLTKRWFCPDHAIEGKNIDNKFYDETATPAPEPPVPTTEDKLENLYKELE